LICHFEKQPTIGDLAGGGRGDLAGGGRGDLAGGGRGDLAGGEITAHKKSPLAEAFL